MRSYSEFIEIIGAKSPGNTVAITPEEYASHLCFYAVSFDPFSISMKNYYISFFILKQINLTGCVGCNNSHQHSASESRGVVSCEIVFETIPTKPLQLMCFQTHWKMITVDSMRSLKIDY